MNAEDFLSAEDFLESPQSTTQPKSAEAFLSAEDFLGGDDERAKLKNDLIGQQKQLERSANPSKGERIAHGTQSFRQGMGNLAADTLDSIAIFAKRMGRKYPLLGEEKPLSEYDTHKAAEYVRKAVAPDPVPALEGDVWTELVPQAMGNAVAFLAGGAATRSRYAFPMVVGALTQGAQGYDDAIQHGASEDVAFKSWLLNAGIGTTEILPVSEILGRLDKASGGTFKKALIHAGKETFEEAFQEALQQAGQNTIANYYAGYDPERDWKEGLEESVAGAGPSGFLMSVLGSLGSHVKSRMRGQRTVQTQDSMGTTTVTPNGARRVTPVTQEGQTLGSVAAPEGMDRAGTYLLFEYEGKPLETGPFPAGADLDTYRKDTERAWTGAVFKGTRTVTELSDNAALAAQQAAEVTAQPVEDPAELHTEANEMARQAREEQQQEAQPVSAEEFLEPEEHAAAQQALDEEMADEDPGEKHTEAEAMAGEDVFVGNAKDFLEETAPPVEDPAELHTEANEMARQARLEQQHGPQQKAEAVRRRSIVNDVAALPVGSQVKRLSDGATYTKGEKFWTKDDNGLMSDDVLVGNRIANGEYQILTSPKAAEESKINERPDEQSSDQREPLRQPSVAGEAGVDEGEQSGAGETVVSPGQVEGSAGSVNREVNGPGAALAEQRVDAGGGEQPRVPDRSEGRKLERGGQPAAAIERGGTEEPSRLAPQSAPQREVAPLSEADQNHVIEPGDEIGSGGAKTKARQNIEAIKLLKRLEAENRNPTKEEKKILAKYVGWGGIPQAFDGMNKQWASVAEELAALLTDEEYARARESTLNAHYTDIPVVRDIWSGLQHMGFTGGKVLEPSAGSGNFLGAMPTALRSRTQISAVELDSITGRILAKLYPQAQVHVMGFEKARFPVNSFQLLTGNVPFGDFGVYDPKYADANLNIHNYFIVRGLDLLKPGGVMMVITSSNTLDRPGSAKAREMMAERADLIAAIRLPNNAFKGNAGTEVTTDILIFRKKDGSTRFAGETFRNVETGKTYKGEDVPLNEYFIRHPENMLGKMSLEGTMYAEKQPALLPNEGQDLHTALSEAMGKLPLNVFGSKVEMSEAQGPDESGEATSAKEGTLVLKSGALYRVEEGTLKRPEWSGDKAKVARATDYIYLKQAAKDLIGFQLDPEKSDEFIETSRAELNRIYDAYVKKHGALGENKSSFLEDDDVEFPLALALELQVMRVEEVTDSKGNKKNKRVTEFHKAEIFSKRTIFPRVAPTHADTAEDAMSISLSYQNRVDLPYVARLLGKTEEQAKAQLLAEGLAFENPESGLLETPDEYLSGNVKKKLKAALEAVGEAPQYAPNVEALKRVIPADIKIQDIGVRLGSTWVPPEVISSFLADQLGVRAEVYYTEVTGKWAVSPQSGWANEVNATTFGTKHFNGHELVELALNLKGPVVYTDLGDGKKEKNQQASLAALEKQEQLKTKFVDWVKRHEIYGPDLAKVYNENFNGVVVRQFTGPKWKHYPGANEGIALREHQKSVVTRILQGSTLLAHAVGTGKTFIMTTAAMEMRRMGMAKKPMIVVQNATISQFGASFKRLYPAAKVLVPSEKQREGKNRKRLTSMIATGDWDAVIVPQSWINMLKDDEAREEAYITQRKEELEEAKRAMGRTRGRDPRVKDIERALKGLEERLNKLKDRKTDDVVTFEQLGVDALFVDEAHEYKKLEFATQMDSVKGLDRGRSQRAFSMFMKMRHVQEKSGGKNTVFATGTPVSNTIAEAWNMMRMVRPDVLEEYHISDFDQFASTFGEVIFDWELTAGGTWKQVQRFAKFTNGPELIAAWRTVADVVLKSDVKGMNEPAMKNGKPTTVALVPTPQLKRYIEFLREQLAEFEKMSGQAKKDNSHIPLVTFTNAKKASLDMRLIDSSLPDEETSKLNAAADRIAEIYHATRENKGTQMVFADLYQNPDGKFNLYAELKRKLVERGLPERDVQSVLEHDNEAARATLFNRMRVGDVSVLIGSSSKMGVGVDVPQRMVALHHLDAPLRPMDMEQRNGRIIRQGNENTEVEILQYGVRGSLDAAIFQKLETKQRFINQILSGDVGRDFDDAANEATLNFAEQKAALSDDPLVKKKVMLENQIRKLESLRRSHVGEIQDARAKLRNLAERERPRLQQKLEGDTARSEQVKQAFDGENFTLESGNTKITGKKEVSEALESVFKAGIEKVKAVAEKGGHANDVQENLPAVKLNGTTIELAAVQPVDLTTGKARVNSEAFVAWKLAGDANLSHVKTGRGFLASLESRVDAIGGEPQRTQDAIKDTEKRITELSGFVEQPFGQEADYQQALIEGKQLIAEMEARAKQAEQEDAAESRVKELLERKPKGMRIDFGRPEAGFANFKILADLATVGAKFVREGATTLAAFTKRMVQTFGAKVKGFVDKVWQRIQNVQAAQALGLSPEGVANVNRIEAQSENVNSKPEIEPAYPEGKYDDVMRKMRRTSQRMIYFGSEQLLREKQLLDLQESYQAAAVRTQSENLWKELEKGAYEGRPDEWKLPRFMKTGAWVKRLRDFQKLALPIAAHLNVTAGTKGNWAFSDFQMRAGLMNQKEFTKGGHQIGDVILMDNPLTGEKQELTIGDVVRVDNRVGYQLIREMPAAQQKEIYEHYSNEYPELMWIVDMFVDPALAQARVQINGVHIPVFNRFALATAMALNNPNFSAVEAYTPDVFISRSLMGAIKGYVGLKRGTRSPGRKYKTGAARESGNVRDLFTGFNIRTFQMLQEEARSRFFRAVVKEAKPIPGGGLPDGFTKLDTGLDSLWEAVKRLRQMELPRDPLTGQPIFPQTEARMQTQPGGEAEYKAFFKEAAQLRGKQLMLPTALVDMLVRKHTAQKVHSGLFALGAWLVRNSTQLYLAMPKTYVANVLTNDMFSLEAAYRYAISGTLKVVGGSIQGKQELRFARGILTGMAFNRFVGLRSMLNAGNKGEFARAIKEILPDAIFADATQLSDVKVRYDDSAWDLLRNGEIGGAVLQAIKYGTIDVRAKQRMAYAFLKANAVTSAKSQGLKGPAFKRAVDQYMKSPPMQDVQQAVAAANFEYLNYADSPEWLNSFSRNDFGRLILPFPRFGYHFMAKQAQRASAVKLLIGKVPKGQRAAAFADLVTVGTFGLGAGGVVLTALLRGLLKWDDDDDDDARQFIGTSVVKYIDDDGELKVKPIDRTLITANRVNLSYWARGMGIESGTDDFWLRTRNYPAVAMAGAFVLAVNDTKKYGVAQGVGTYLQTVTDLAGDFFSVGMAVKVPDKVLAELRSLQTGKPEPSVFDPYAANVPMSAYVTSQVMDSFVPGSRQFNEVIMWIDPVERRKTASKTLDYDPGVKEALKVDHVTGLLDRMFGGEPLPPAGTIDRRSGEVSEPRDIPFLTRAASAAGFNLKSVNREDYLKAIGDVE
jgi:N12 class adenine-specific DNA methylase